MEANGPASIPSIEDATHKLARPSPKADADPKPADSQ